MLHHRGVISTSPILLSESVAYAMPTCTPCAHALHSLLPAARLHSACILTASSSFNFRLPSSRQALPFQTAKGCRWSCSSNPTSLSTEIICTYLVSLGAELMVHAPLNCLHQTAAPIPSDQLANAVVFPAPDHLEGRFVQAGSRCRLAIITAHPLRSIPCLCLSVTSVLWQCLMRARRRVRIHQHER